MENSLVKKVIATITGKSLDTFVAVDIGTSFIKVMEVDSSTSPATLIAAGIAPTPADAVSNNVVTKPEDVGMVIASLIEQNDIRATKAIIGIPGPSAFTKKINSTSSDLKELDNTIVFEASNYIPHRIEAVHFDYQITGQSGSSLEVLLVAVKNEVVSSYVQAVESAGLSPGIADVDYFALENMFEICRPETVANTVALLNIGARFTSVNIISDGVSLFTGDIAIGGRLYTDALCEALGMKPLDAERAKQGEIPEGYDVSLVNETIERTTEHVVSEIHRQLGFFWNAAATEEAIGAIFLSGGGAQQVGLADELAVRTGISCSVLDPFKGVSWSENFDEEFINEVKGSMGVGVGLALRKFGDKQHAV